jgi:hypothetical protein
VAVGAVGRGACGVCAFVGARAVTGAFVGAFVAAFVGAAFVGAHEGGHEGTFVVVVFVGAVNFRRF